MTGLLRTLGGIDALVAKRDRMAPVWERRLRRDTAFVGQRRTYRDEDVAPTDPFKAH